MLALLIFMAVLDLRCCAQAVWLGCKGVLMPWLLVAEHRL